MARLRELGRRVAALPRRARVALAAAVVLSVVAVGLLAWPGDGGDDDAPADDPAVADGTSGSTTSTTLATGGIEIDAPEGWMAIPVPALGFGVAVPPGWEATLLSTEGLSTLAGATPAVPDFVENAHAAAAAAGVLYAAGVDRRAG